MNLSELKEKLADRTSRRLEALFLYRNSDSDEVKKRAKRNVYLASGLGVLIVAVVGAVLLGMSCAFSDVTSVDGDDAVYVRIKPGMNSS